MKGRKLERVLVVKGWRREEMGKCTASKKVKYPKTVVLNTGPFCLLDFPKDIWQLGGDIFCYLTTVVRVGYKPEMQLRILQCTGQPIAKNHPAPIRTVPRLGKPSPGGRLQIGSILRTLTVIPTHLFLGFESS